MIAPSPIVRRRRVAPAGSPTRPPIAGTLPSVTASSITTPRPSTTPARITTLAPITASSGITTSGATNSPGARSEATSPLTASPRGRATSRSAAPSRTQRLASSASYLALSRGRAPGPGRARRRWRVRPCARRPARVQAHPVVPGAAVLLAVRGLGLGGQHLVPGGRQLRLDPLVCLEGRAQPDQLLLGPPPQPHLPGSSPAPVTGGVRGGPRDDLLEQPHQLVGVGPGLMVLEDQACG